jgi:hypothetical protein
MLMMVNYEFSKLIEIQKNLNNFCLFNNSFIDRDEQFYKLLEKMSIKGRFFFHT